MFLTTVLLFVGLYGGIRGTGKEKRSNNTLGLPSGIVRMCLATLVGTLVVIAFFTGRTEEELFFLISVCFELVGISAPSNIQNIVGYVKSRKED